MGSQLTAQSMNVSKATIANQIPTLSLHLHIELSTLLFDGINLDFSLISKTNAFLFCSYAITISFLIS